MSCFRLTQVFDMVCLRDAHANGDDSIRATVGLHLIRKDYGNEDNVRPAGQPTKIAAFTADERAEADD